MALSLSRLQVVLATVQSVLLDHWTGRVTTILGAINGQVLFQRGLEIFRGFLPGAVLAIPENYKVWHLVNLLGSRLIMKPRPLHAINTQSSGIINKVALHVHDERDQRNIPLSITT